ncbi:unnamed protein product [Urochloa humidicola]
MPLLFRLIVAAAVSFAASGETLYNAAGACRPSSVPCGDSVDVHYPFFLANASDTIDGYTALSYCGYPGMAIACDGGRATLKLKDNNYTVLAIDYDKHTVTVADADVLHGGAAGGGDCPRVTHNVSVPAETSLNLSTAANDKLFFFFGCVFTAGGVAPPPPVIIARINCSSFPEWDGVSYVAAENDVPPQDEWPRACEEAVVVPVLKDLLLMGSHGEYLPRLNSGGYGKLLKKGFQLTWDPSRGPCSLCEQSKGQCSYDQSSGFSGCLCSDGRVRNPACGEFLVLPFSL